MFNFHLLAIAQHYAWKSSLGFLARKMLAVTVERRSSAGKDRKFCIAFILSQKIINFFSL
jgi:hypothetical protein